MSDGQPFAASEEKAGVQRRPFLFFSGTEDVRTRASPLRQRGLYLHVEAFVFQVSCEIFDKQLCLGRQ